MNHWKKICIATYAEHRPAGRGYVIHIDVPEFLDAHRGNGYIPRQVGLRALYELRREGVKGLLVAHPTGLRKCPREVRC